MRRTLRERITARLLLLSATVALLLGTALSLLIVTVAGQRDAARDALRSQEALIISNQIEGSMLASANAVRRFVTTGRERALEPVSEAFARYPDRLGRLQELVGDDARQTQLLRKLDASVRDYRDLWVDPLVRLARQDPRSAESILPSKDRPEHLAGIEAVSQQLRTLQRGAVRERAGRAGDRSALAIGFGVGGLGLVLAVAVGLAFYLGRAVVRPVRTVAHATGRLAAGDLSTRVPATREDELGDLARSFNAMADRLEANRAELAARSEQLEQANSELASRSEQLEQANSELKRSNAELEQFASVTSHDLQAPLVTVTMYAELLERRHAQQLGADRELLEGIRAATGRARALINDLLDYSRAGREAPTLSPVPAQTVIDQALESLAGTVEHTGARVRVEEPLPVVLADPTALTRVVQNLVANAVKFVDGVTPEVTIGADREGEWWRLWVRDNGIGMDPAHARRIFEPFQRLNGEEDYAGTGIGLAVCERIVERHGGRIWAHSRPGEGSVFSFTVPDAGRRPTGATADGAAPG